MRRGLKYGVSHAGFRRAGCFKPIPDEEGTEMLLAATARSIR
jgi:hypothetical protein